MVLLFSALVIIPNKHINKNNNNLFLECESERETHTHKEKKTDTHRQTDNERVKSESFGLMKDYFRCFSKF